jgi:hypothetical protein
MWYCKFACGLVAVAAVVIGCEKEKSATPAAGQTSNAPQSARTDSPSTKPSNQMDSAMRDASKTMSGTAQEAGARMGAAKDAAAADAAKRADAAAGAQPAADSATGGGAQEQAQKLLEQAATYVKDNKWDMADSTLKQVEKLKASLSPEMQKQVDGLRTTVDAKKAAGGMKVPGIGQ